MKNRLRREAAALALILILLLSKINLFAGENDLVFEDQAERICVTGETGKIVLYRYDDESGLLRTYLKSREPFVLRKARIGGIDAFSVIMENPESRRVRRTENLGESGILLSYDRYVFGAASVISALKYDDFMKEFGESGFCESGLKYTENDFYSARQILFYELFQKMITKDFEPVANGLMMTRDGESKETTKEIPKDYYLSSASKKVRDMHGFMLEMLGKADFGELCDISLDYMDIFYSGQVAYLKVNDERGLREEVREALNAKAEPGKKPGDDPDEKTDEKKDERETELGEDTEKESGFEIEPEKRVIKKPNYASLITLFLGLIGIASCIKIGKKDKGWKGFTKAKKRAKRP